MRAWWLGDGIADRAAAADLAQALGDAAHFPRPLVERGGLGEPEEFRQEFDLLGQFRRVAGSPLRWTL